MTEATVVETPGLRARVREYGEAGRAISRLTLPRAEAEHHAGGPRLRRARPAEGDRRAPRARPRPGELPHGDVPGGGPRCRRAAVERPAGDASSAEGTRLERLVNDLLALARKHEIAIPPATTLLVKSLVTIEGVARSLDPNLDLARAALPVVLKALRPRWLDQMAFWRRRSN